MKKNILLALLVVGWMKCDASIVVDSVSYELYGLEATVIGDWDVKTTGPSFTGNYTYYYNSRYKNESYIIPSSISYQGLDYIVTSIAEYAYGRDGEDTYTHNTMSTTKRVVLPYTINSIGDCAFYGCKSLTNIDMGGTKIIRGRAFAGCSNLSNVLMDNVRTIGYMAFSGCKSLVSLIIPPTLASFDEAGGCTFNGCNMLREIFYLPKVAPENWTATSLTYVPDKQAYSNPKWKINNAHIIEMITFDQTEFIYTGQAPTTTWTNNVEGYTATLNMSELSGEVGSYEEWIPVTFTKGSASFTANVVYRYTVTPATLTAKVQNVSREYGEENPMFSLSFSGFVNGESEDVFETQPTITTTANATSDVGEYPLTVSSGKVSNYNLVYESGIPRLP